MEVGNLQLRLENTAQGDGVVGIERNNRVAVAVILCRIQGRLRVRENRTAELQRIGRRMEIRHRIRANCGEVDNKGLAGGKAAQRLVRRARDDRAARRRAGILHDHAAQSFAGGSRRIVDQNSSVAIGDGRAPVA